MERLSGWIYYIERHSRRIKWLAAPVILLMIAGVYALVYYTGGIKYVYSHSMYIPVILSGFIFGAPGGVIAGIVGGIALGQFMPINVSTGEPQELVNWLYRLFFFVTIGGITGAMVSMLKSYIKHVEWLAHHDINTRLPNRLSLIKTLDDHVIREDSQYYSLLVMSVENLQNIIAAFGLESADRLVNKVVTQLSERYPDNIRFFHHHPEHVAILSGMTDRNQIADFARDILGAMNRPYEYENVPLHLDARIGCVYIAETPHSPTSLINRAEYALNEARLLTRDYHIFDENMENMSTQSMALLGSLTRAMEENQLELHYQPKFLFGTSQVMGAEALLRWNHPEMGMVPPGMFVGHAENSSLIQPLTEWVLGTSLRQLSQWKASGLDMQMAINISTRNLLHEDFQDVLVRMLKEYTIPSRALELEVTETSLMHNPEEAMEVLNDITGRGISIAIDDFGTGYSSLQYLNTISASTIKIDQSFIRDMTANDSARHIVESAIALSHSLGSKVVSEGIETAENYAQLADMGCDIGQGYYLGRPMPADRFTEWMQMRQVN